jgi:hypothetical protein
VDGVGGVLGKRSKKVGGEGGWEGFIALPKIGSVVCYLVAHALVTGRVRATLIMQYEKHMVECPGACAGEDSI